MKAKIFSTTFKSCGLDVTMNFLQAPKCDCGGYANPVIRSKDELYEFISMLLSEHDCEHCAIFAITKKGAAIMGAKMYGEIAFMGTNGGPKYLARYAISEMQEEFGFHCYGLLEQATKDTYRIVMD